MEARRGRGGGYLNPHNIPTPCVRAWSSAVGEKKTGGGEHTEIYIHNHRVVITSDVLYNWQVITIVNNVTHLDRAVWMLINFQHWNSDPSPTPPSPTPIEPGGTYAHSPSPEPPISGKRVKDIPPISGIGYHWQYYKNTPFSRLSREIFPRLLPKNTPLPEKMGMRMRSLMHSSVGGGGGNYTPSYIFNERM